MATTQRLAAVAVNQTTFAARYGIDIASIGRLPIAVIGREASAEVMLSLIHI